MRPFEVVALETRRASFPVPVSGAYAFSEKAKAHWLQRLCLWTLRKLGCQYWTKEERLTRVRINPKSVMEAIFRQREEVADMLGDRPMRLFIGAEDYSELMSDPANLPYIDFATSYNYRQGNERRIIGMTVTVVPWMKGVLVVRDSA